eukprot:3202890-Rhodomonas_salina.1
MSLDRCRYEPMQPICQCPVLTWRMPMRLLSGHSSTDVANGAVRHTVFQCAEPRLQTPGT